MLNVRSQIMQQTFSNQDVIKGEYLLQGKLIKLVCASLTRRALNMYEKKPAHYAILQREAISQEPLRPKGKVFCQVCRLSSEICREICEEMWKESSNTIRLCYLNFEHD